MMTRVVWMLAWVAVLGLVFCASDVHANCICPHMPMGQQGGYYLHYASVHDDSCNYLYATGYVSDQPLSNMNCVGTCSLSPCFPLGGVISVPLWFDVDVWAYAQVDTQPEFRRYLDHLNGGVHVDAYDSASFDLVGTVELTRNAGVRTFYAVIYKMTGSDGNVAYMGVEISNSDGHPIRNRPQFNAVQTYADQPGIPRHYPVPGMLTVDLGSFRYASVQLNLTTNGNATYAACNPPVHTPLPNPPHANFAPNLSPNLAADSSSSAPVQAVALGGQKYWIGQLPAAVNTVGYCIPRRARGRRCR